MMKVMKERCDQCLYGPNKIVCNARRAEILRDVKRRDSFFICHKGSMVDEDICCAGDWEKNGGGQLGRIMGRLGAVEFVEDPTK